MDREGLKIAVENGFIEWRRHALERMMKRKIRRDVIKEVLLQGEIIEDYPDTSPYPSALFLGWSEGEPFHVVSAFDSLSGYCLVITAYRPDLEHFGEDYKTRRKYVS